MKWKIIGTMLAAGSLAATAVRAQETDTGTAAAPTGQSAQPAMPPPYGAYVDGDATPDADGVPVAKPNPISNFLDHAVDEPPVEMPLIDEPHEPPPPENLAPDSP